MSKILFKDSRILLDNKPITLLCSSLFYFRIPEELWEDRIIKIKNLGYNCLDVYFPWNFHEVSEDCWDFTGIRNVTKFLELTKKHNMYVVGRPGPYICSEWDLGSLPSYLLTKENIKLRDNNKIYLSYVKKWYDIILPILKEFQVTNNGNILMIQLENELDFYDCSDRYGYIYALKEMAIEDGIVVPLIACTGQGDIEGATGSVEDIYPAMNFYPNSYDPNFIKLAEYYSEILNKKNYPLLVTETNREAFFLRRLLGAGVKLIGPYNQVGGTDFDFYNAVNNWGNPLSFLTSDYDFGSIVKPSGEYNYDFKEAYIFKGLITTFNENIGDSILLTNHSFTLKTNDSTIAPLTVLKNTKNEYFLTLANCGDTESKVVISSKDPSMFCEDTIKLNSKHCQMLFYNIQLDRFGFNGLISYSSSEILDINMDNHILNITTFTRIAGKIIINTPSLIKKVSNESLCSIHDNFITINLPSNEYNVSIYLHDNSIININNISYDSIICPNTTIHLTNDNVKISIAKIPHLSNDYFAPCKTSLYLEDNNIYSGYGLYRDSIDITSEVCKYILLENPTDILSLYLNGDYQGTFTPGGNNLLVTPLAEYNGSIDLLLKAEIWGHTNFDDIALPCTAMASKKGIKNLIYITNIEDISYGWNLVQVGHEKKSYPIHSNFGSFLSTIIPFYGVYEKAIQINSNNNSYYLMLEDSSLNGKVYVNNTFAGEICNHAPILNISQHISSNTSFHLRIEVTKESHRISNGSIKLLSGYSSSNIEVQKFHKQNIIDLTETIKEYLPSSLPLNLSHGNDYLVKLEIKSYYSDLYISIKAKNIKLTTLVNDTITSRIMISNNESSPVMCGGNNDKIFVPKSWLDKSNGSFYIYVEAINFDECILEYLEINSINF